jgi:hypothetical protein
MLKTPAAADLLFSSSNFSGTIIGKVIAVKQFQFILRRCRVG